MDQYTIDDWKPRRSLNRLVLTGAVHDGRIRRLTFHHDPHEGRGAILWPIGMLLVLFGAVVVTQLAKVWP